MLKKNNKLLYEALIENSAISANDLGPIVKEAETTGADLQQILVKKEILSEKEIIEILARKLKLTCFDLKKSPKINRC